MKRRDALKSAGLLLGYTVAVGTTSAVIGGCSADPKTGWEPEFLSHKDAGLLKDLASTILPGSDDHPGAADVMIEKFIDETLTNYYSEAERNMFQEGLKEMKEKMPKKFNEESKMTFIKSELDNGSEFMKKIHELSIVGYCTSERGAKETLIFNPIPGEQRGCIPFEEVRGIWYI